MTDYWLQLLVVCILLLCGGFFAGSEIALISLREGQLRRLEGQTGAGRTVARLARDPNRFLATIQIGITLAGFLASATLAVTLAAPLAPALQFLGAAAEPAAVLLITMTLAFLTLVIAELTPKRVAMQHAERWALAVARPIATLSVIAAPVVWLLGRSTNAAVRLLGSDPEKHRDEITPAEIRDLVASHRGFTTEQRMIISGAVEITERKLRQVLVSRRAVFTLDADTPVGEACAALAGSGHSRAPVVRGGSLDHTVGLVNLRDLVTAGTATLEDVTRPVTLLPDSLHAAEALRRFKAEREQFALVVDEHGTVAGIVTLEDLVEEVVGEIYDETDRDVRAVQRAPDGSLLLPGTFPIHDLPDVGVHLSRPPGGDYTTVAGLVISALGHLPRQPGETVEVETWTAQVTEIDGHAITGVRLRPRPSPDPDPNPNPASRRS